MAREVARLLLHTLKFLLFSGPFLASLEHMFVLEDFVTLEQLAAERRELDAREAAWLRSVAAYDRSGRAQIDGYVSAASALRDRCNMTPGAASGHVKLARKLESLPIVADAFAAGEISRQHVRVIADAYTPERETTLAEFEPVLVQTAQHVSPKDLHEIVRHATDALDGDGGAGADAEDHTRRRLHISSTIGGIAVLDAQFAADQAEIVTSAVNAEMEHDRQPNETRNPAQRRADALVNICRRALDNGELGSTRNVRPHLITVADLARLDGTAELISDARIEAAHIGRLSKATLDRIACDCDISRIIMNGRSEVLDVGRATRIISPALWKALVARDRHCTHPGCDKPPGRCEAHHIVPWQHGGSTNLENLQLLCWHHHRARHEEFAGLRAQARARAPG